MKKGEQKIIVIVGPTASGKSALAVSLARKFNGEIISADSRQIYRGLTIGSGKVPGKWQPERSTAITTISRRSSGDGSKRVFIFRDIPHHCIDFVSPRRIFTAADFVRRARRAIDAIARRGRVPIIAGGTAFWIDALVYDFSLPAVKPDARIRRALEKKSPAQLLAILKKCDPRRAAGIEQKNPRRIIRAIEIARELGHVPKLKRRPAYDALWIGIHPPDEVMSHRIEERINAMIRQGLVAETKKLFRQGVSQKRIREFGFEYAAALDAASEKIPRAELAPHIIRDTQKYATRQMRWWKRNTEIRWITTPMRANPLVKTFLQKTS